MNLSFQRSTGLKNARFNCIFKFGSFLTSNCSLDINFEASVVILILRTVNTRLYIKLNLHKKNVHIPRKHTSNPK